MYYNFIFRAACHTNSVFWVDRIQKNEEIRKLSKSNFTVLQTTIDLVIKYVPYTLCVV